MKTELTKELLITELKTKTPQDIAIKYKYHVDTVRAKIRKFNILRSRHAHLINNDFFKIINCDSAYILGFLFADGSINTSLHHNQINVQLNKKDIEVLNFIKEKIQPTSNVHIYDRIDKRTKKKFKIAFVSFSSKEIVKDLINLGCIPNKTYKEIRVPHIPEQFYPDFIRGVFDGDGSVYFLKKRNARSSICCSSLPFIKDLQNIIGFGKICISSNPYKLQFYSKKDIQNFYHYMYNGNFCLKRKFEKFNEVIKKYE